MIVLVITIIVVIIIISSWFYYYCTFSSVGKKTRHSIPTMTTTLPPRSITLEDLPIYCINLESESERRSYIEKSFSDQGLHINMVPAVDTRGELWKKYIHHLTDDGKKCLQDALYNKKRKHHHELTPGAIGCFLSHVKTWSLLMESDQNVCLILEDDSSPPPDFSNQLTKILSKLPSDTDIFLLNHIINGGSKNVDDDIMKMDPPIAFYYMNCYLITRRGIEKIMNDLDANNNQFYKQIDSHLSDLINIHVLQVYFLKEPICHQVFVSPTTIQTITI